MNIAHETIDGVKTLCGRAVNGNAQIESDERDWNDPDCRSCRRVLHKRTKASGALPAAQAGAGRTRARDAYDRTDHPRA